MQLIISDLCNEYDIHKYNLEQVFLSIANFLGHLALHADNFFP